MVQDEGRGLTPVTPTAPKKRVTFSRPPTAGIRKKQQAVGDEGELKRKTQRSKPLSQSAQVPKNTLPQSGRSKHVRPHSKTTVNSVPLKTRLNCNHLRPRCKCSSIANKKKTGKAKSKSPAADAPRRVLSSTRTLPRGELNGRKNYDTTSETVSVLDATWKPKLNIYSKESVVTTEDKESTAVSNKQSKKKLRFVDDNTKPGETHSTVGGKDATVEHNAQRDQKQHEHQSSDTCQSPRTDCDCHPQPQEAPGATRDPGRLQYETLPDYCTLCELTEKKYPDKSFYRRKDYKSYEDENKNLSLPYRRHSQLCFQNGSHELCYLCQKSRCHHHCLYHSYLCDVCEGCESQFLPQDDFNLGRKSFAPETRKSLSCGDSAPSLLSDTDGDEDELLMPATKIPYEPKTKFVKNLKQKLETNYWKKETLLKGEKVEKRGRCRATGGPGALPQRRDEPSLHTHSSHRCIHRYQQNDRLFLEPTIADQEGLSLCSECGAPQPSEPGKDHYLYHITLGGIKSSGNEKVASAAEKILSNNQHTGGQENSEQVHHHRSRRESSDPSKHIYAKLNKSIGSILPSSDVCSLHSRPPHIFSYPTHLNSKRHPSKSMALTDHIV